jgi:hypothetical protein
MRQLLTVLSPLVLPSACAYQTLKFAGRVKISPERDGAEWPALHRQTDAVHRLSLPSGRRFHSRFCRQGERREHLLIIVACGHRFPLRRLFLQFSSDVISSGSMNASLTSSTCFRGVLALRAMSRQHPTLYLYS